MMQKKRILYILHEKNLGGATLSFLDFIEKVRVYYIPIIIIPEEGSVSNKLDEIGIEFYVVPFMLDFIPIYQKSDAAHLLMNNNIAAKNISRLIKREHIDLVHSNTSVVNVGILAAIYAGVPHVWHIRELVDKQFDYKYVDEELKKKLFSYSDEIIAISSCVKNNIKRKYGISSNKIYNAIYCKRIEHLVDSDNNFLFLGAITKNKGQWDAVRAAKILEDKRIKFTLYIIGSPDIKTIWTIKRYIKKEQLEDRIIIKDYTRNLDEFRAKCGFAIIGSRYEALGRVTIEAMLTGSIPIGVNTAGTKEIIGDDGKRGFLYEFGNYNQLAEKMIEAMSLKEKDEMRKKNRRYAEREFSSDKYAKEIFEIYEKLIGSIPKASNAREEIIQFINAHCQEHRLNENLNRENRRKKINISIIQSKLLAYIEKYGIKHVALYGMARIGCALYDFLEEMGYDITTVFDRSPDIMGDVINVSSIGDYLSEDTELLIVTVVNDYTRIKKELANHYIVPIVGVDEFL